jgi:rSAM/selenodomain-associated transferase 1
VDIAVKEPTVIIMGKRPRVGYNKTRLSPPLSLEQSTALYEAMLLDTLALVEGLEGIRPAVAVTPPQDAGYFRAQVGPRTLVYPVDGPHIGACLDRVLARALDEGYAPALAINSDGPSLPPDYIRQAVTLLTQAVEPPDVVLGPNYDGGYYLVGVNEAHPALFAGVAWSTEQVWEQTLANAGLAGLRVEALPPWHDVDTAADIDVLRADVEAATPDRLAHTRRFFEQIDSPLQGG